MKTETEYRFTLIVCGTFSDDISEIELLNATDTLGEAGCDDAGVSTQGGNLKLEFDRAHDSLQHAIISAVQDVETAGFKVLSIRMDRDSAFAEAG